jgi:hypothetical protein
MEGDQDQDQGRWAELGDQENIRAVVEWDFLKG